MKTLVVVNLVYAGPEAEGKALAQPLIDLGAITVQSVWTWVDLSVKGAGGFNNVQCIKGPLYSLYGLTSKVLGTSAVVAMEQEFSAMVQAYPDISGAAFLIESFAVQAVDALPANFSAFPHRGHINHFLDFDVSWTNDSVADIGNAWAQKWRDFFNEPSRAATYVE